MKYFLLLSLVLHGFYPLSAQRTGLIFDEPMYRHLSDSCMKAQNRGRIPKKPLELYHSLKNVCPQVGYQENMSCAAWAVCYGALSIDRTARQKQHKDETFSAAYVYNQVAYSDESGVSVENVLNFVQKQGTCRDITFSSRYLYPQRPNERGIAEAPYFKIAGFETVFYKNSVESFNRDLLKRYLCNNKTIILCLNADTLLANAFKKPTLLPPNTAHALCLIGYDDRDSTFELLNSWGEDWGDKGYLRVPQKVLLQQGRILGAYSLRLDAMDPPNEIALFQVGKSSEEVMQFNNTLPFLKYFVTKANFLTKTHLEIRLNALRDAQKAYILTQEIANQWEIDSICAQDKTHKREFEFTGVGKDFVYVIFAHTTLDWETHLKALQTVPGQPYEQLQIVFKDYLDAQAVYGSYRPSVRFQSNKIAILGFSIEAK